ncbi:MAG: hypothetical protein Q9165_008640 [Trypethelium subeluteriae]
MLSRGSSNAGNRLRRAKSGSSAASKHQQSSTQSLDPAVARQYAEVAAATAYERALGAKQNIRSNVDSNKISCISRSQGSHLQGSLAAARLQPGASRSCQGHDANNENPQTPKRLVRSDPISKAQSLIEFDSQLKTPRTAEEDHATEPSSFRRIRKSKSLRLTSEAQPVVREGVFADRVPKKDGSSIKSVLKRSRISLHASPSSDLAAQLNGHSTNEDATDRELVTRARDRIFQQLHTRRLRESTSFMALSRSFKKIPDDQKGNWEHKDVARYDDKLASPERDQQSSRTTARLRDRARVLSAPLANSFKRFLRRSSTSSDFPAQQTEASRLYFGPSQTPNQSPPALALPPERGGSQTSTNFSPPSTMTVKHPVPAINSLTPSQYSISGATSSLGRSRVTSWSDSTVANTVGTAISQQLPVINEHASIPDPASFYEQKPSMNIKHVFNRQGSRSSKNSEKSEKRLSNATQRIYSALMKKTEHSSLNNEETQAALSNQSPDTRPVLDILPSRRQLAKLSRRGRLSKGTIRTVTPDNHAAKLRKRSIDKSLPLPKEVSMSLDENHSTVLQADGGSTTLLNDDGTPTTDEEIGVPVGGDPWVPTTASPTKDLLEQRACRARNRWKTSLKDGGSPFFSSRMTRHSPSEFPYELRPNHHPVRLHKSHAELSQDIFNDRYGGGHYPSGFERTRLAREMMSPSIYSRDTDGQSKQQLSPASKQGGAETTITITKHDVQNIPIASTQKSPSHPRLSSQSTSDWRAWLTQEIPGLDFSAEITISEVNEDSGGVAGGIRLGEEQAHSFPSHRRETAQIVTPEAPARDTVSGGNAIINHESAQSAKETQLRTLRQSPTFCNDLDSDRRKEASRVCGKNARERLQEMTPSQMNERFPMLDTGMSLNNLDLRGTRKASPESLVSTLPSPVQQSRIANPIPPAAPDHKSNPLKDPTDESKALHQSSAPPPSHSNPTGRHAPPPADPTSTSHRTAPPSTNPNPRPSHPPRTTPTPDFHSTSRDEQHAFKPASPSLLEQPLPRHPSPRALSPSSTTPHLPPTTNTTTTTAAGKENAPSPRTPITKAVAAWVRDPRGGGAARISATPGSSPHSIRSRRMRPSQSVASLKRSGGGGGREAEGGLSETGKVTPVMLDKWLEARQGGWGEDGTAGGEAGRKGSYAFL